jgi:hypothetical protein
MTTKGRGGAARDQADHRRPWRYSGDAAKPAARITIDSAHGEMAAVTVKNGERKCGIYSIR